MANVFYPEQKDYIDKLNLLADLLLNLEFTSLANTTLTAAHDNGRYTPTLASSAFTVPAGLLGSTELENFGVIFNNPGTITFTPASGVTLNGGTSPVVCENSTTKRMVGLIQTAANTFQILGA